ncbi:MAG: glycosyltransferase [Bacilli bacterium]|nr:glycosyltransferase [Bacilli bacterium]
MPVYNVKRIYLSDCLDSILKQTYQNFEICIADDCSTNKETIETLKEYEKKDSRIKVIYCKKNGHISVATNKALTLAKGEFVALMDNDDMLLENALNEVIIVLNKNKNLDLIYTDEDKIDLEGNRCEPHFKSDFQLDSLYGGNYICHLSVIRKSIIDKVKGFRKTYEGAQDFDLFLRITDITKNIYHIPKILYHWRKVPGSTALSSESKNYAGEAGKRALEDLFKKKKIDVDINIMINTHYFVNYLLKDIPKVSIIINLNKEIINLIRCLDSIYRITTYQNFEIIILCEKGKINHLKDILKTHENYKATIIEKGKEFKEVDSYNLGSKQSTGEYLVFLNEFNNIKTNNWLEIMVGYAAQKQIGCVGVKILSDQKLVKSCGIVVNNETVFADAFEKISKYDYGVYGRLLVPHNYTAVRINGMMIKKSKFIEAGGFIKNTETIISNLYFCFKIKEKYRNVAIPQVEIINYRILNKKTEKKILINNKSKLIKKWPNSFSNDDCYNKNMNKKNLFNLDKKS